MKKSSDSARGLTTVSGGERPLFYYITDRRQLKGISLRDAVESAVRWGVDFIQIREKDLSDRDLFELTAMAVRLVRARPCKILVNGRPDVAAAAGAHGVHLPSRGLRCRDIRPWLPPDFLIGVSVHSGFEALRVSLENPDYLLLGPIFPTPSKLKYGAPLGLSRFAEASRKVRVPVLGLGGIHPDRIASVLHAGAAGVAGISMFQDLWARRSRTAPAREFLP